MALGTLRTSLCIAAIRTFELLRAMMFRAEEWGLSERDSPVDDGRGLEKLDEDDDQAALGHEGAGKPFFKVGLGPVGREHQGPGPESEAYYAGATPRFRVHCIAPQPCSETNPLPCQEL